jgi:hypothetical protein
VLVVRVGSARAPKVKGATMAWRGCGEERNEQPRCSRGEGRLPWEDVVVLVGKIAHPWSRGDGHGDDGSRGGGIG